MRQAFDWDTIIMYAFSRNCGEGIYVDVGAAKGKYTELFSKMAGPNGKVYSFEINEECLRILNMGRSSNVTVVDMAIADKVSQIEYFDGSGMSNIIGFDTGYTDSVSNGKIKCTTLDEYFKNIKVDYLKIDIEGAELAAIRGGINTIKNCKFCVIETHFDYHWHQIYSLLIENELYFKNIMNDKIIFCYKTQAEEGLSSEGRPYQIYLKNK